MINDTNLFNLLFEEIHEEDTLNITVLNNTARNLLKRISSFMSSKPKEELMTYFIKDRAGRLDYLKLSIIDSNFKDLYLAIRDKAVYGMDSNVETEYESKNIESGVEYSIISLYEKFPDRTQNDAAQYNEWLLNNYVKILYVKQRFFINSFIQIYREGGIDYLEQVIPKKKPTGNKDKEQLPPPEKKPKAKQPDQQKQVERLVRDFALDDEDKNSLASMGLKKWIANYGLEKLNTKYRKSMPPFLYRMYMKYLRRYLGRDFY